MRNSAHNYEWEDTMVVMPMWVVYTWAYAILAGSVGWIFWFYYTAAMVAEMVGLVPPIKDVLPLWYVILLESSAIAAIISSLGIAVNPRWVLTKD